MKKAVVLIIGMLAYVWYMQATKAVAERGLADLQNLYTSSQTQATGLLSSSR